MIKFHNKRNPFQGSLVGKFVFADGGMLWASYSSPVLVIREKGVSLEGQSLKRTMQSGVIVATSVSDEDETKTMRVTSVACVCDTLDEVNAVFRANFASRSLYDASVKEGRELFTALDGTEVIPETAPAQRSMKP
ncbi:hypothetical protein O9X98_15390 [Agrobacterium salinitolerans]|nr:hypothetical protein [Agrobacterium salinitolerans]